jgi:5'-nucleotidase
MSYPIDEKLVIATASSALFDLSESDRIFREEGLEAYRKYQRKHEEDVLEPGVAFPLIDRLLDLQLGEDGEHPVEVVLLSRNDPDTGLRVFHSIQAHDLRIQRAAFTSGENPFRYMDAFNACLFLSADEDSVYQAIERGLPAGLVHPTQFEDDDHNELRIAFDFDGVIVDDSAEAVHQEEGLNAFHESERANAEEALSEGPLQPFFQKLAMLQEAEIKRSGPESGYEPRLRIGIVTARGAPAHERVVTTLREMGIHVDESFFLGGVDKSRVLEEFRPHIFFDDQETHIEDTKEITPSVHVPYGIKNE